MYSRTAVSASRLLLQHARRPPALGQPRLALLRTGGQNRSARLLPSRRFHSTPVPDQGSKAAVGSGPSSGGSSGALVGGVAGGVVAFALGYLWYHFSGAKAVVQASKKTQAYIETAKKKVASTAADLEPNEALEWLRSTSLKYAALIPGAKRYVNSAFDDLDRIREKHGDEVDKAVSEAYSELRSVVSKKGVGIESAGKAWEILGTFADRVGGLAGDAAQDILDNHPQLKDKLGGSIDQLKKLSEAYGPQVKKEIDSAWQQVGDVIKSGSTPEALEKARKLVQETIEKVKGMVDETWNKGMEQAKPYLDRNPKVKELVEDNQDALKQGDFTQLWDLVKQASEKGGMDNLEKFVREKVQQAKDAGMGGLDQLLKIVPGGDRIVSQLEMLQSIAEKRGKEAEKILRETMEEIQEVLKKKAEEAKDLADKAKNEA